MKKPFVVFVIAVAFGSTAVVAKDLGDRPHEGGAVVPCSLDGVNPAFGFVRSADGTWHVRPGCRR